MHPNHFDDRIDEQIVSTLLYGIKQKVELEETVDAAERTVDNHVERLEENHDKLIEDKKGREKYYYLDLDFGDRTEPIQPKPTADDAKVQDILLNIKESLNELQSENQLATWLASSDLIKYTDELKSECYNHQVLSSDNNFRLYFSCFDEILEVLSEYEIENELARNNVGDFIKAASDILDNWSIGMEHRDFRMELVDRDEELYQAAIDFDIHLSIQMIAILKQVNIDFAQRATIENLKTLDFDNIRVHMGVIFEVFGSENNMNKFFNIIEKKTNGLSSEEADRLEHVADLVRYRYTGYGM